MNTYTEVTSIETLIESVKNTFQHWIDSHNKADCLMNLDDYAHNGVVDFRYLAIENNYVTVTKKEVMQYYLENTKEFIYDENDSLIEVFLSEIMTVDELEDEKVSFEVAQRLIRDFVFPRYFEALSPMTLPITEELKSYLVEFETLKNNVDRVSWLIKALSVTHVHGNVVLDYSHFVCDFEYDDFDNIRNNGLESFFDRQEVIDYLSQ